MSYPAWRSRLLEGVDTDLYPAEWLDRRVASGRARFWGNESGAILAEIKTYPSGVKEVHGLVAAGDVDAVKALIPLAEQWGRQCGATRGSISSHPAWARIMRDAGYEPTQLTIVKGL
jgi:hypothetical protein